MTKQHLYIPHSLSFFRDNLDTIFIHHCLIVLAAAAASSQSGEDEEAGRDTQAKSSGWHTGGERRASTAELQRSVHVSTRMNNSCAGRYDTHTGCCGVFMVHRSPHRRNRAFLLVSLREPIHI